MTTTLRDHWNASRWNGPAHYESWFVRANHPSQPLALWIRYTIFAPAGDDAAAEGELWAIWFDGERLPVRTRYAAIPATACSFDRQRLDVRIGDARLDDSRLAGRIDGADGPFEWDLALDGGDSPLLLFPAASYERGFPKAKVVVPRPRCALSGEVRIGTDRIAINAWPGSQNHNWGPAHTDRYAWGQVIGFDERDDAILECASARVRLGPVLSPWLTMAVLRLGDEELAFNRVLRAPFARVEVQGPAWGFSTGDGRNRLRVSMRTTPSALGRLTYRNPPGGSKTCLNTKIATCDVRLERPGAPPIRLHSEHGAAFELLGMPD